jgi:PAS domain S-box-containing protein
MKEMPRDVSFCRYTILGREVLEIHDTDGDARFTENPFVRSGARFYAGVPIVDSGDHALGTLCVIDQIPRSLTEEQRAVLRALARQVAVQIEIRRYAAELAASTAETLRAKAELEAERALLRGVLRAATTYAIFACDPEGTICVFNEGAERLLGYRAPEILGRATAILFHDPAEISARASELAVAPGFEVFAAAARCDEIEAREWTYVRKDGGRVPVSLSVTASRDDAGALTGFVGVARDITAERRAEEERARLRSEQDASRAKDEFLAALSHELRTPLTAVIGWTNVLEKGPHDAALTARGLSIIARNAAAQLRLVEDMLDVSRIVTRRLEVTRAPVDLGATVRAAADAADPLASEAGIHLEVVIADAALTVLGDAGRLQQIVGNLLRNAIKFTPRGGRIDVGLDRAADQARIRVADTGEGISGDLLPYVFEPFRQSESSRHRSRGGLGLGLSIVKHLVEVHGGTVTAESGGSGQGATFTVLLPLVGERRIRSEDDEPA